RPGATDENRLLLADGPVIAREHRRQCFVERLHGKGAGRQVGHRIDLPPIRSTFWSSKVPAVIMAWTWRTLKRALRFTLAKRRVMGEPSLLKVVGFHNRSKGALRGPIPGGALGPVGRSPPGAMPRW